MKPGLNVSMYTYVSHKICLPAFVLVLYHCLTFMSTGIIIPIFKNNGETNDPNCYRGITLMSCLSKLFTSVINNHLNKLIEGNKILNENQAGFRKGYSTIDNIFLVSSLINLMCSKKKKLFCAFVDYQKAFHSIWREALSSKLLKEGISGKIINLPLVLKSMYSKIRSCVMVNESI